MGRRAAGLIAAVLSAVPVLAGCRSDGVSTADSLPSTYVTDAATSTPTSTSPDTAPAPTDTTPDVDRATGAWEQLGDDAEMPPAPPGEVQLDACRWRSPSLYSLDITWTPAADVEGPIVLPLAFVLTSGDQGTG